MITQHAVQQGSEEWQQIRAGKYTGSNAHKLLRYGAIDYALTEAGAFGGNFYTKRGHVLEDEAIELYEQIYGRQVERPGFITNDKYTICGYSPDGVDDQILLEVKCFNQKRHMTIYKGDIPLEILAQIHFGLMITELKQARLLIYNPDLEIPFAFKAIDIKSNRNIQANFKRKLMKGIKI